MRPGITGPWQVHRRQGTTYDERVAMDCAYVENWSLPQDALLLVRTLAAPFQTTER
jgi:exopolysaccharide production protein ExoY